MKRNTSPKASPLHEQDDVSRDRDVDTSREDDGDVVAAPRSRDVEDIQETDDEDILAEEDLADEGDLDIEPDDSRGY